jgi:hypothetical protein
MPVFVSHHLKPPLERTNPEASSTLGFESAGADVRTGEGVWHECVGYSARSVGVVRLKLDGEEATYMVAMRLDSWRMANTP